MAKRIIKTLLILTVIIPLLLLVFNIDKYIEVTNRLLEVLDISNLRNFFENFSYNREIVPNETINSILETISDIFDSISNFFQRPLDEILLDILLNVLIFIVNFLNYVVNVGFSVSILLMIYYKETFKGTNLKIKYSKGALLFITISKVISLVIDKTIDTIGFIIKNIKIHKRKIATLILFLIISNGLLYQILVEALIFFISYIYHAINLETYKIFSSVTRTILIIIIPIIRSIPFYILIIILIFLIFSNAINKAERRLKYNHIRLKKFAKDTLTQTTFINGAPGSGKTLLNMSLSLASEENFIDELEEKMLEYELRYKYLNFAKVRNNPDDFKEHQEYIDYYNLLNNRKSFVIANYAIYSPYFRDFSKIFDFNFMRKNLPSPVYALEEYTVISISELDKEYNSHDNMKEVGADGVATFFSTVSHDLKRHVKIFCDYQLKDQVPLRIRGNSEYFYKVEKRIKKYPFILGLYYAPFKVLSKVTRKLIIKYEIKKSYINKKTKRSTIAEYKRKDFTLLYAMLRNLAYTLNKISNFFDHYWYFKIKGQLSENDGQTGKRHNININICDLSINNHALYDSTFLSHAYAQKKNTNFNDLDKFTSLTPTIDELSKCNSRFYDKINNKKQEQEDK